MDKSRWIIFAVLCVVILGGLVYFNRTERVDVSGIDGASVINGEEDGTFADNIYGNPDSEVVLVEYGDFQCPGCASVAGPLAQLKQDYADDIAFAYRHFPLVANHPNALATAAAAEAAGRQDKFWEMHDLLFARQSQWSPVAANERTQVLEGYATELGLNLEQFREDLVDSQISSKINFQRSLGGEMGVNSTPTFFLNGEKLGNDVISDLSNNDGKDLRQQIDKALGK